MDNKTESITTNVLGYKTGDTRKSIFFISIFLLVGLFILILMYYNFPPLLEEEKIHVKLPRNLQDAKNLGRVLLKYRDSHYSHVIGAFVVVYIFLQTFAIPGSIFLSILSGFLLPFIFALLLVCTCSAIGASLCYLLSSVLGSPVVARYIPERAAEWSRKVFKHRQHLLNYIIFLRITPFLPNWFINIVSPILCVPLHTFFIATFVGVAPPSSAYIQLGSTLNNVMSTSEVFSFWYIGLLVFFAIISLLPVIFRKNLEKLD